MHYCFNEFFYLQVLQAYLSNFGWVQNWHETVILPFNPLLLYFPYLAASLPSDGGKFLYLSLFVTAVGFHRLLLIFCGIQLVDSMEWL